MSRRKVRGLTRTGRQVSEDPDIDNLLSTLSPEEVEELEKEVMTVPDPDPNETFGIRQGSRLGKQPSLNNNKEAKRDPCEHETELPQRQLSFEGEPRKESRKQEYLRKMGLSQERSLSRSASQDGGPQRQGSVSGEEECKTEEKNCLEGGDLREVIRGEENRDREFLGGKGKERDEESKKKAENNSKTKELISKLQPEKKEDSKEKEGRKREEGKTKELISRLQEKKETEERERKEEAKRKDDGKTKGLVSRLEEKKSQVKEKDKGLVSRLEEKQSQVKEKDKGEEKSSSERQIESQEGEKDELREKGKEKRERYGGRDKENERGERKAVREEKEKEEEEKKEEEKKEKDNMEEKERDEKDRENELGKEKSSKFSTNEKPGSGKSPVSKTTEEEGDDEAASMFDEPLEKVRNNDPTMIELNVNNSEVIKTKTLIQFTEALKDNTHVKTFALANTRADDHVAYAIAGTLRSNKTVTSINLDSNHLTSKGIIALIRALQHNTTLTELRFHNQRHICGGKTEMEMAKVLKDNTTLLKLGYHFELAGPRMTMTNILSRNMDRQRQRRLQEQKQAQANGEKKGSALEVPKPSGGFLRGSPRGSPKVSPLPSPQPSPIPSPKRKLDDGGGGARGREELQGPAAGLHTDHQHETTEKGRRTQASTLSVDVKPKL
ncbi:hypothetical protein SKAU_G00006390 [Synaphobranchus kaupii]|uniref:Leiomodin-1 n=1 Tax=Synaphobranchus kaupii TaxID=118154 RepID=A0A9Q1G972_SYNKA|nr:hypothetical protein SKAU_G00006390 [Synaphobranchus kaupii]